MKLVIDVMGFENDVSQAISACKKFYKSHSDAEFILVGSKKIIEENDDTSDFEIIDAQDVIKMDENPLSALRKTNSSMYKAIELVANNKADGVLSAGSTACYVALVFHLLKKIDGIDKIGFMPYVPTTIGGGFNMIDVGASKECSGKDLYNFAIMANVYCKEVIHIASPRIGVINIGTEDDKGFIYHQQAHNLLKSNKSINYVGYVEPRNLLNGVVDIAVSDGYTGNITLKSMEGGLKALQNALKQQYKKPWNWFGALFSLSAIKNVSKTFDYRNNAGAMVVGVRKVAFKTHGSADEQQFYSSIRMLYETVKSKINEKIQEVITNG